MKNSEYLDSVQKLFAYYKGLCEKSMAQLPDDRLFFAANENTNSIAVIVQHLHGNMLSRWTDFLASDGEKPWRDRDGEFEPMALSKLELLQKWDAGWGCLFDALGSLTADDLSKIVYIRNEGHTVMEAVNRQLAHYSYHAGQIVFAAKMLKESEWQSLSIPKNSSAKYNSGKFSLEKRKAHFTDSEFGDNER